MSDDDKEPMGIGEKWLVDTLTFNVHKMHLNQILTFAGPPGCGKSCSAMRTAELIDPGFNLDRVIFPSQTAAEDTIDAIRDPSMPPGSVIIPDDFGMIVPARKFWTVINQGFGQVAQGSRYLCKIINVTVPDQSFVDSQPRKLTNFHLEFMPRDRPDSPACARVYEIQSNPRSGKIYYKHPQISGNTYLDEILFHLPTKLLHSSYQVKKRKLMNDYYANLADELRSGKIPEDDIHAKLILACETLGSRLDMTQGEVAEVIGIARESFSRALRKAREYRRLESVVTPEVELAI